MSRNCEHNLSIQVNHQQGHQKCKKIVKYARSSRVTLRVQKNCYTVITLHGHMWRFPLIRVGRKIYVRRLSGIRASAEKLSHLSRIFYFKLSRPQDYSMILSATSSIRADILINVFPTDKERDDLRGRNNLREK